MHQLTHACQSGHSLGGALLTGLSTLAVAEVNSVDIVVAGCHGGADGRIHATGKAENGSRTERIKNRHRRPAPRWSRPEHAVPNLHSACAPRAAHETPHPASCLRSLPAE